MKTIVRITNHYDGDDTYQEFKDELDNILNDEDGLDCFCEIKNDRYINIVEDIKKTKTHKEDYKNCTTITAIGYSQGDWQEYKIYHNEEEDSEKLKRLVDELKNSFTHFNDYWVEKFEQEIINGKEFNAKPHDYTSFGIRNIEFPEKEDVEKAYNDIYGEDYDEIIIEID